MIVQLKDVSKNFKNNEVFKNINVTFRPNKIYGLIGPNGSGKTVLLKIICGIFNPDTGEVLFDGENYIKKYGIPKSTRAIIEHPEMIGELSGFDNLKLIASIQKRINDDRINQVLQLVGLQNDKNKKYKEYSLGMKQKLGLAQVIMEDEELFILDEPFNGLDEKSTFLVRNLLKNYKKAGKTIIIATHSKEDIDQLIDEAYKIEDGMLVRVK